MQPPKQEYFGQAEAESDSKQMCQSGKSYRNQVGSQLLLQLWFLQPHSRGQIKSKSFIEQITKKNINKDKIIMNKPVLLSRPLFRSHDQVQDFHF